MSLVRNAFAAAAGLALCASAAAPAAARTAQRTASVPSASVADTLHYQVRAGDPFLVVLPARADGRPAAYRVVSAPALSWLVDRSFYWKTLPSERGTMAVVFEQSAASDETLVLVVDIVG